MSFLHRTTEAAIESYDGIGRQDSQDRIQRQPVTKFGVRDVVRERK